MMAKIQAKGIAITFVTLHVASGTFRPVKVENLQEHVMHKEYFEVPEQNMTDTLQDSLKVLVTQKL
jgi:S-adenosylmethionine:tRNA ribosyltransferase-isomerase